jgi:hypothetical protein
MKLFQQPVNKKLPKGLLPRSIAFGVAFEGFLLVLFQLPWLILPSPAFGIRPSLSVTMLVDCISFLHRWLHSLPVLRLSQLLGPSAGEAVWILLISAIWSLLLWTVFSSREAKREHTNEERVNVVPR